MLLEHAFSTSYSIYPLTFLQIIQTANRYGQLDVESSPNQIGDFPAKWWWAHMIWSAYHHLTTSAYGLFRKDQLVGWIYLRGWQQILYVETLGVLPEFHGQGFDNALLSFGVQIARELRRGWLSLAIPFQDSSLVQQLEQQGFQRGHWRILRSEHTVPDGGNSQILLRRIVGPTARRIYREFAIEDLQASEPDTAMVQSHFLLQDPYYSQAGQHWVIETDGRQVGFAHLHGSPSHQTMILTAVPHVWGSLPMLSIMKIALGAASPDILDIRLGSGGHHDAALTVLKPFGFEECPADIVRMFKQIERE